MFHSGSTHLYLFSFLFDYFCPIFVSNFKDSFLRQKEQIEGGGEALHIYILC